VVSDGMYPSWAGARKSTYARGARVKGKAPSEAATSTESMRIVTSLIMRCKKGNVKHVSKNQSA